MKELDLTKGSVSGTLARFAVPFLLANVLQALYGGADLFVTGQFDDAASVAGVAIGSQVMQTVTGIILGLATGTTVLIAIASGSKNEREAADTIGTSIWLFGIIAAALTLAMTTLHGHLAQLMHTPAEAMADTRHYLLICSAGIPFITGYNVVCAILRGLGDSRTPLYFYFFKLLQLQNKFKPNYRTIYCQITEQIQAKLPNFKKYAYLYHCILKEYGRI